jgi:hypothetical protein
MKVRSSSLVAVALAGALALAGCGSSSSTTGAGTPGGTSSPSASQTSAAPAVGDSVDGKAVAEKMQAAMKDKGKVSAVITVKGQSLGKVTMDMASTPPKVAMAMSSGGMSLEIRMVDNVMYIKGFPAAMSGGKTWVKIDGNGTDAFSKQMKKSLDSANDPTAQAKMLEGLQMKLVDETGGISHYTVSIPMKDYLKNLPTDQASAAASLGDSIEAEYYVDADNLPTKIVMSNLDMVMEYKDWGTAPDIVAPPAAEVGTLPAGALG